MNERIKLLAEQAVEETHQMMIMEFKNFESKLYEKFAELIVAKVLDEVAFRAYVSGDRAWSDDADRHWVELEFGFGRLAKMKNERTN
jgi:hypothetical protein